jgi:hypothetical protein
VAPVSSASLFLPRLLPAKITAVALSAVAMRADAEDVGGAAAPCALGLAVVSVAGGMATIMSVGEDIYGGLTIRR